MRTRPGLIEHLPRLRRYARALTGDASRADDLVQDTLERVLAKLDLWQPGSDLRAWLFTLMHNLFVNQIRARRPQETAVDEAPDQPVSGGQLEALVARVEAWAAQSRLLHGAFDTVLNEPLPLNLVRAARRSALGAPLRALAASFALVAAGLVGYALGMSGQVSPPLPPARLACDAAIAHAVFSPATRHPVEVDAAHADHLVARLSKRIGTRLKAPDFSAQGFQMLGGRLLAGETGPVAQFMYEDSLERRVTLYVRRTAADRGAPPSTTRARAIWTCSTGSMAISATRSRAPSAARRCSSSPRRRIVSWTPAFSSRSPDQRSHRPARLRAPAGRVRWPRRP